MSTATLYEKALASACKYLERNKYEVLEIDADGFGIVARDADDTIVFIDFKVKSDGDEYDKEEFDRHAMEVGAVKWLAKHVDDIEDTPIRFDAIAVLVLQDNGHALLRHHKSCFEETL